MPQDSDSNSDKERLSPPAINLRALSDSACITHLFVPDPTVKCEFKTGLSFQYDYAPLQCSSDPTKRGSDPCLSGNVPSKRGSDPSLSGNVPTKRGSVPSLRANIPTKRESVPSLSGNVPTKRGSVPSLSGNVPTKSANVPAKSAARGVPNPPQITFL